MKDEIMPLVIDWQVTDSCNRNCTFCYGPKRNTGTIDFEQSKKLIDIICNLGAKVIGLTGGEALLHKDISDILLYSNSKELKIGLNTNCDLYMEFQKIILQTVSALEIPIEYNDSKTHDFYRGKGSYQNIVNALQHSYRNSDIFYRIGTVLHSQGIDDLKRIEELLYEFSDRIIYWKIYEYIPYSNKYMEEIENSHQRFNHLKSIAWQNGLGSLIGKDKILFDSFHDRKHSYFLINPTGEVFIPSSIDDKPSEKIIGNLLTGDIKEILDFWGNEVNVKGYTSCKRCIFRKIGYI